MTHLLRRFLLSLVLIFTAARAAAVPPPPELPLELFFGNPQLTSLKISPDGRYLAMLQPVNNRLNITVIDRVKGTKKRLTDMKEENVTGIYWLNDHRLGFEQEFKGQESKGIYAINADGTGMSVLRQLVARDGERVDNAPEKSYELVDLLPEDPDHILVSIFRGSSGLGDLFKQNIVTEKFTMVLTNPGKIRGWLTDRAGVVRIGIATDEKNGGKEILYRSDAKSDWVTIETLPVEAEWEPLGFEGDNRTLYVRARIGRSTAAIYAYDPELRKITRTVFADDTYDAGDIIYDRHQKKVVGVTCDRDKPTTIWLDPVMRRLVADIDGALPGMQNEIVSRTRDNSLVVIRSFSDRDPGTYFLLDTVKMELSQLIQIRNLVKPEQMAEMRPIEFKASDGLLLHGYLTLPVGRNPKNLPLILNPHGGPFGPRDSWGFNREIQFLANRGYAVLQVNYRGSGGYGRDFEEAGYRQWGLRMQADLTDAVHWAIAEGIADSKRVGIYGASYGGYAALAGMVYTPELYQVGINYVGVADIARLGMIFDGFRGAYRPQREQIARRWLNPDDATDKKQIYATSPINFIENIRVPSLHAYGEYDPRVTKDQGAVLKAALEKHNKTFKYIQVENEGHGFKKAENAIAFYGAMETFLQQYMPAENMGHVKIGDSKVIEMPAKVH